jgi:hypothetical protein
MTMISEDRLRELAEEYGDMAGKLTGELQDGPGAASAFYMSASLGEVASIALELLSLRTSPPPSGEAGERESVIEWCAEEIEVLQQSLVAACNRSFNAGDQGSAIIERNQADGIRAAVALLHSKGDAIRALPTIKEPTDGKQGGE